MEMLIENHVNFTHDRLAEIKNRLKVSLSSGKAPPRIFMVNLLKFKPQAVYADGRPSQLTGKQAYQLYGKSVSKIVNKLGGRVLYVGDVQGLVIGNVSPALWDEVAIVEYPSLEHFLGMIASEEYKEAAVHRIAGLEGQLLIETHNKAKL